MNERDFAKKTLAHYFKVCKPDLPAESINEIENIVDNIIIAAINETIGELNDMMPIPETHPEPYLEDEQPEPEKPSPQAKVKFRTLQKLINMWVNQQASWRDDDAETIMNVWGAIFGHIERVEGDSLREPREFLIDPDELLEAGLSVGILIDTEDRFE